jgi:phospholipid/cholesterol/gamma-HCH transport system ATP-binding protein
VNTKVFDNLALPLRYHGGLSEAEIERRVMAALESVGMTAAAHRFPFELTIARQKLCTLARALVRDAEAVFFDNFVTGTEATVFHTLTRLVRNTRSRRGTAWMLVLESDASIFPIADRICVFEDGKLIETSTPKALRESGDVRVSRLFHAANLADEETAAHDPGAAAPSRETPAPG